MNDKTNYDNEHERPDLFLYEDKQKEYSLEYDIFFEEYELCKCCGFQSLKRNLYFRCPICLWKYDEDIGENENIASFENNGLSLLEAKFNFNAFGISDTKYFDFEE